MLSTELHLLSDVVCYSYTTEEVFTMDQPYANQDTQYNGMRSKNIDEKFCETCGAIIKIKAEICPTCGVRQRRGVDKTALLLFTFFLGGIGGHKFYTGKNLQGALYLLFCWTGIPSLIALVEFIAYAFTSSEKLEEKFEASGGGAIIAIVAAGISFISIAGILAAIAIPQFVTYRNRA
jgi:TM2 domain-containing membrane protein YozV